MTGHFISGYRAEKCGTQLSLTRNYYKVHVVHYYGMISFVLQNSLMLLHDLSTVKSLVSYLDVICIISRCEQQLSL